MTLLLSLFIGYFGIDRFYLGDIGLGILKIVLALLFGIGFIWVLLNIYFGYKKAKEINFNKILLLS